MPRSCSSRTLLPNSGGCRRVTRGCWSWMLLVVVVLLSAAAAVVSWCRSRPQNRVVMSLRPRPWPEVPAVTAQVARAAFGKKGALPIRIRDELGGWYADVDFA